MADRGVVRVIGVGNRDRGDDGVGPAIAEAVADRQLPGVEVMVSEPDPSRLVDRWASADTVVLVDAVIDGSAAGSVVTIDAATGPLPTDLGAVSSHGVGIAATVELTRALGRMPRRMTVIGVTGERFDGTGLSPAVARAIPAAVSKVMEVVNDA